MIPKIMHHVWLGGPIPEEFARYRQTWREHFPDWEMRLWGDGDDYGWMPPDSLAGFRSAPTLSGRSDWLRYALLAEFGGMYIDTDFECFRNFEYLFNDVDAFAAAEAADVISVGIIGCTPGHPLFRYVVEHQPDWDNAHQTPNAALRSGPGFFTAVAKQYVRNGGQPLTVFGPHLFYPYGYHEKHRRGEAFPDAVAAHHWASSWQKPSQEVIDKREKHRQTIARHVVQVVAGEELPKGGVKLGVAPERRKSEDKRQKMMRVRPCVSLGTVVEHLNAKQCGCGGGTYVYGCGFEGIGKATRVNRVEGIACCLDCPHYNPKKA